MSRTDVQRWRDLRSTRRRAYREIRKCECGERFMPDIRGQEVCRRCAGQAANAERAPVSADEAERDRFAVLLRRALEADARHRPIPLAEPESGEAKLRRRADRTVVRLDVPAAAPPRAGPAGKAGRKGWTRVARRRIEDGWPLHKVAKRLGVPLDDVRAWAILTADEARWRAQADGKYARADAFEADEQGDRREQLPWCRAKATGRCPECRKKVFAGERITRVDGRWVHDSCAERLGFEIISPDRRSDRRKAIDRRLASRLEHEHPEVPR